jgi:DNA polymerase-3 subunit epsilon
MDFVAIDFETANESPSSACQLGAVVVRGGVVTDRHCWWIRPRPARFNSHNIAIHGITPRRVQQEPEFDRHWDSIHQVIDGQVLVAHNAGFDIGVLRACLLHHGLAIPNLQYTCTRAVARQAWPNRSGYGLRAIADRLGVSFRHHDGLEDAEACAKILLAAADRCGQLTVDALEQRLKISRGRAGQWGCAGPRLISRGQSRYNSGQWSRGGSGAAAGWERSNSSDGDRYRSGAVVYQRRLPLRDALEPATARSVDKSRSNVERWLAHVSQTQIFANRTVVFTGLLTRLDRADAERIVQAAGGTVRSAVSRRTDLVVVGEPDARTLRAGRTISTKQERAEQLRCQGQTIDIVSEHDWFISWLPSSAEQGSPENPRVAGIEDAD